MNERKLYDRIYFKEATEVEIKGALVEETNRKFD